MRLHVLTEPTRIGPRNPTMAGEVVGSERAIAIWVLRVFLGLVFLGIGVAKLIGVWQLVQFFVAIGWGQWFRFATGLLDIAGAVLLFVPRSTFYGALLLVCTVGSATLICLTILHQNSAVPLALTLLAATEAWLTRPRRQN
jgi:uncharacterized membrane protein YphA (DoxX/SURF4 family)